jgi:hypothetical protein
VELDLVGVGAMVRRRSSNRRYVGMVGLDFLAGDDQFSLHVETIRREIFESTRLDS